MTTPFNPNDWRQEHRPNPDTGTMNDTRYGGLAALTFFTTGTIWFIVDLISRLL